MFQDQESVHLEAKYHEFNENGGQLNRFLVDAGHWIDFSTMRMISVHDESDQREILRGEQGKRRKRPSAKKFLSDTNFNLNKFMAVNNNFKNDRNNGGMFLGETYMLRRDFLFFTVKDLTDGIRAYAKIWAEDQVKAEQKKANPGISEEKLQEILEA